MASDGDPGNTMGRSAIARFLWPDVGFFFFSFFTVMYVMIYSMMKFTAIVRSVVAVAVVVAPHKAVWLCIADMSCSSPKRNITGVVCGLAGNPYPCPSGVPVLVVSG